MELENSKITFNIAEFVKWIIQFIILIGTAVALYYNLTNEFNIVKNELNRLNKEFEEMKTEFKLHLKETR